MFYTVLNLSGFAAGGTETFLFSVTDEELDPREAMTAAISEFLKTEEGQKLKEENGKPFDLYDVVMAIGDAQWRRHGLILRSYPLIVDFDVHHSFDEFC